MPVQPVIKGAGSVAKLGALGIMKWIFQHWYVFMIILFLIPNIIMSVNTAIETKNPSHPFIVLGLSIVNADTLIYEDVQTLKENPAELIKAEKPEKGYWKNFVYWWHIFLVGWKFAGNIFLISIPFTLAYDYFRVKGQKGMVSSTANNFKNAFLLGMIFIFVVNLVLIIIGLIDGTLLISLPENADIFQKSWMIIKLSFPFHGVISLVIYLVQLKINV